MKKLPEQICWIGVFALVLVSLGTGCGSRATPTPEPRTIQFIIYDYPNEQIAPYQRLADEFHTAHPELTVAIQPVSGSSSLRSAVEAGADVVLSWGWALGDVGELRPLDPFIETEKAGFLDDYLPQAVKTIRYQGQVVALPADLDTLVLYYNKELFDRAGAPYPAPGWTWNDFLTSAQAVTQATGDENAQYGFYPSGALPNYLPFVAQELSALWGDDLLNPEAMRLDSEATIRAIQWYTDLALLHGVMPTPSQQRRQYADPISLGRAGMWIDWASNRGGRQSGVQWKFNWGVATVPQGSTACTISIMALYAIPTRAKHPEDAWQWLSFVSSRVEQANGVPVRQSLLKGAAFQELVGADRAPVFAQAAQDGVLVAPGGQFEAYATVLERAVNDILENGEAVEETLRKAQQRVEGGG